MTSTCKGCENRRPGCHSNECPTWAAHEADKQRRYAANLLRAQSYRNPSYMERAKNQHFPLEINCIERKNG